MCCRNELELLAYPSTQRADVRTNLSFITTEVQVGPAAECVTLFSPEFFILSFLLCSPHANNKKKSFFTHVQVLPFYHIKLLTKFAFGLITVLFSIYYLNIIIKCWNIAIDLNDTNISRMTNYLYQLLTRSESTGSTRFSTVKWHELRWFTALSN